MLKVLVIGYGSIGMRHTAVLKELGCQTAVMSRRSIDFYPSYTSLPEAIDGFQPEYVVVATRTSEHY